MIGHACVSASAPRLYADAWRALAALMQIREAVSTDSLEQLAEHISEVPLPDPDISAAAPMLQAVRLALALVAAERRRMAKQFDTLAKFSASMLLLPLSSARSGIGAEFACAYVQLDRLCPEKLTREHARAVLDVVQTQKPEIKPDNVEFLLEIDGRIKCEHRFRPYLLTPHIPWIFMDAEARAMSACAKSAGRNVDQYLGSPLMPLSLFSKGYIKDLYAQRDKSQLSFWELVQLGRLAPAAETESLVQGWILASENLNGDRGLTSGAFFCLSCVLRELSLRGTTGHETALRLLDSLIFKIEASSPPLSSGAFMFLQSLETDPKLLSPRLQRHKRGALSKWFALALRQRLETDSSHGSVDTYQAFGVAIQPVFDIWEPAFEQRETLAQKSSCLQSYFSSQRVQKIVAECHPPTSRAFEYAFLLTKLNIKPTHKFTAPERPPMESEILAMYTLAQALLKCPEPFRHQVKMLVKDLVTKAEESVMQSGEFSERNAHRELLDIALPVLGSTKTIAGYSIEIWRLNPDITIFKKWINTCFNDYIFQRSPTFIRRTSQFLIEDTPIPLEVPMLADVLRKAIASQGPWAPNRMLLAQFELPKDAHEPVSEFLAFSSAEICLSSAEHLAKALKKSNHREVLFELMLRVLSSHGAEIAAELCLLFGPILRDPVSATMILLDLKSKISSVELKIEQLASFYKAKPLQFFEKVARPVLAGWVLRGNSVTEFPFQVFGLSYPMELVWSYPPVALLPEWYKNLNSTPALNVINISKGALVATLDLKTKIEILRAVPTIPGPEVFLNSSALNFTLSNEELVSVVLALFQGAAELHDANALHLAIARAELAINITRDSLKGRLYLCRELLLAIQSMDAQDDCLEYRRLTSILEKHYTYLDLDTAPEIYCSARNLNIALNIQVQELACLARLSEEPLYDDLQQCLKLMALAGLPREVAKFIIQNADKYSKEMFDEIDKDAALSLAKWCAVLGIHREALDAYLASILLDAGVTDLDNDRPTQGKNAPSEAEARSTLSQILHVLCQQHGYVLARRLHETFQSLESSIFTSPPAPKVHQQTPEKLVLQVHALLSTYSGIDFSAAFGPIDSVASAVLAPHLELALSRAPTSAKSIASSLGDLYNDAVEFDGLFDVSLVFRRRNIAFVRPEHILFAAAELNNVPEGLMAAELAWSGGNSSDEQLRQGVIESESMKTLCRTEKDLFEALYAPTSLSSLGMELAPWRRLVFDVAKAEAEPSKRTIHELADVMAEAGANVTAQRISGPFNPWTYEIGWRLQQWDLPEANIESEDCHEALFALLSSKPLAALETLRPLAFRQLCLGNNQLMLILSEKSVLASELCETRLKLRDVPAELAINFGKQAHEALMAGDKEIALVHALKLEDLAASFQKARNLAASVGAHVAWAFGEHQRAISLMQALLPPINTNKQNYLVSLYTGPTDLRISKSKTFLTLASWSLEARHMAPDRVATDLLKPAISSAQKDHEKEAALITFARFSEAQAKSATLAAAEASAQRLAAAGDPDGKSQIAHVAEVRQAHRVSAIKMYLEALSLSGGHASNCGARAVALWLAEPLNTDIQAAVKLFIPQIAAKEFLPWVNQLASSLEQTRSEFQRNLATVLLRMARFHPYAVAWRLFALRAYVGEAGKARAEAGNVVWLAAKKISTEVGQKFSAVSRCGRAMLALAARPAPRARTNKQTLQDAVGAQFTRFWVDELPQLSLPLPTNHSSDMETDESGKKDAVIVGVESTVEIASGLSRPRILTVRLSNGQKAQMLIKGGSDDPRQDSVMQQVFAHANAALSADSAARRRELRMETYAVVPVGPNAGAIELVSGTQSLLQVLTQAHRGRDDSGWTATRARELMVGAQGRDRSTRLAVYTEICQHIRPSLRHFFFSEYPSAEQWLKRRKGFVRSCAVSSIVGYILGLGDRHCSNILLSHGCVVHIDLGVAFDAGTRLRVPETVPFRLSRDIVDGFGISGAQGAFSRCMETTLTVLRQKQDELLTVLDVLRYDPLYSWRGRDEESPDEPGAAIAERALQSVRAKLAPELSAEAQVRELVSQATDPENLAVLYAGWQPYY